MTGPDSFDRLSPVNQLAAIGLLDPECNGSPEAIKSLGARLRVKEIERLAKYGVGVGIIARGDLAPDDLG